MNTSAYTFDTQSLGLTGVVNARELGGYVLPDGKRIRKGVLLRGGGLKTATDEDIRRLEDIYKVSFVFDFRTEGEVKHAPDIALKACRHLWLPTIDEKTEKVKEFSLPKEAYSCLDKYVVEHAQEHSVQDIARRMYPTIVSNEYTQLQYAAFLQEIVMNVNGVFYWHCSQGKDRTGMGAAFLLAALGADRDLIIRDFELSNEYYRELIDKLCNLVASKGGDEEALKVIMTFVGVNTEYFIDALNIIDSNYGGMDRYLRNELCLSDDDIQVLRDRLLE